MTISKKVIRKQPNSISAAIHWWEDELNGEERNKLLKEEWKGTTEERHKLLLTLYKTYLRSKAKKEKKLIKV